MFRKLVLGTLLTFSLASTAWAADRNNLQVFRDVSRQVHQCPYFTIFEAVHAGVDNGVVTLTGKVTVPYKSAEIAKRVGKVDGVRRVQNKLQVLPASTFDDQLRVGIARAIYSHPSLSQYGMGSNPSIHVIVERGRVTLDGVVNNDADKMIARSVASSFDSFGVKNELKTNDEMRREMERL